jgi:hypothetical protein
VNLNVDAIVMEVLFRLGHTTKAHLIKGFDYPETDQPDYGYTQWIASRDALLENMILWIPQLTSAQMMSVASGMPIDELSAWCLDALLKGVKVHVKKERLGFDPEACVPSPLTRKHVEALKLLVDSGLNVVEKTKSGSSVKYYDGRLLCEKEVMKWTRESIRELIVSDQTLLTPAAMDALRSEQIKWRKE